jgi:hypothetical protein
MNRRLRWFTRLLLLLLLIEFWNFFLLLHIMLRDLLTQKCTQKKVTDFGYPRAENIKLKIGSRSLLYQLFSKRD